MLKSLVVFYGHIQSVIYSSVYHRIIVSILDHLSTACRAKAASYFRHLNLVQG